MVLDTTTTSLIFKLAGSVAANELEWSSSWSVRSAGKEEWDGADGASSGTSEVTLVTAPESGVRHVVTNITIHNKDTAAAVVIVEKAIGATRRRQARLSVPANSSIQYTEFAGWSFVPEEHNSVTVANLTTTGALVVGTTLSVGTDATIGDDLTVTDDCQIGGDLVVSGVSTLTGAVGCSSTLQVTGNVTADADLEVSGDLHIATFGAVSPIAAKGDLLAGTANDALGVLSVGANETCVVADSGQSTGLKYANRSRALSVATGTGSTNSSSASESSDLISYTFTAGYFNTAGKTVRVTIWGKCGTTGTPTLNVRNKLNDTLGAQTIGSPSATSPGTGVSDRLVFTQLLITTNTTGSSGRLYCMALQGHGTSIGANHGGVAADYLTLNLNNAITVSQTSQWSVSSSSNTHTPLAIIVEELN
jgi:hypothetical protein